MLLYLVVQGFQGTLFLLLFPYLLSIPFLLAFLIFQVFLAGLLFQGILLSHLFQVALLVQEDQLDQYFPSCLFVHEFHSDLEGLLLLLVLFHQGIQPVLKIIYYYLLFI